MSIITYHRELPCLSDFDVVVLGSGPAGLCAAVSAARNGSKVALVERYGVLGGNLTAGFVGPILGMVSKGTMRDELVGMLGVPDNDMIGEVAVAHDIEKAKRVVADFADLDGIQVFLQTSVFDVLREGDEIKGVVVSCKDGPRVISGNIYIDSTGDGDVAYLSGCKVEKGRGDGLMQPATLEYTIDNVDESKAIVCIGDVDEVKFGDIPFLEYCRQCADKGELPKNLAAVRLHRTVNPGERRVNTTQANGVDGTRTSDLFSAELKLRSQIDIVTDFLRSHLPGYENCKVVGSGTTIGLRETRRVIGDYILTRDDVVEGRRFDDVIVHKAEFVVDIHNPAGAGQAEKKIQYCTPYDIPYRCFTPIGLRNLYTAGRCISGTHEAHASYRVMSICMAMGQAVGLAASMCSAENIGTRELDIKKLQSKLESLGIDLFSN